MTAEYSIETPESDERTIDTSTTTTIFLAGSIEMGKAARWHEDAARRIASAWDGGDIHFYNPRREEAFTPDMELDQIRWEQRRLLSCDYIFMVIDPHTKSPISLLEFGEFIASGKMFVVCPESFYRYNNLVVTADVYGQKIFPTIDDAISMLLAKRRQHVGAGL
jgi:hypothetical protein